MGERPRNGSPRIVQCTTYTTVQGLHQGSDPGQPEFRVWAFPPGPRPCARNTTIRSCPTGLRELRKQGERTTRERNRKGDGDDDGAAGDKGTDGPGDEGDGAGSGHHSFSALHVPGTVLSLSDKVFGRSVLACLFGLSAREGKG